ncbi:MAG: FAD-dependent oxidoreductase [Caldilineaceae bacterium]
MYLQAKIKIVLFTLLLLLLAPGTMAMRQPQHRSEDRPRGQKSVLAVASHLTMHHGEDVYLLARLTTAHGEPIPAAEVAIVASPAFSERLRTDSDGLAAYHLPSELDAGRYMVKIVFSGAPHLGAAIAVTELRVLPALPGHVGEPDEASASINPTSVPPTPLPTATSLPTATPVPTATSMPTATPEPTIARASQHTGQAPTESRQSAAITHVGPADEEDMLDTDAGANSLDDLTDSGGIAVALANPAGAASAVTIRRPSITKPTTPAPANASPTNHLSFLQVALLVTGLSTMAHNAPGALPLTALGSIILLGLLLRPVLVGGNRAPMSAWPSRRAHTSKRWRRFLARLRHWELPMPLWYVLRVSSVGIALGMSVVLWVRPEMGLFLFWRAFIPMVPLLFFIAPGLWRNICPMAALNQTPRLFHFTQGLTLPKWLQDYGYIVAISLFLLLVTSRKWLFNHNGPALAILILLALSAAFVTGNFFKGKSGWCSSICPLLPIQRIYGQTPFVNVTNTHCQPCIGCTKNCYDLNPKNAYLADLYDEDHHFAAYRKFFVGLFPGFILAFYTMPEPPAITIAAMYGVFALYCLVSLGSFFLIDSLAKVTSNKITVLYGAAALNLYYWFNAPTLGALISTPAPLVFVWGLRTLVLALTLFWIYRTYQKEAEYIELVLAPQSIFVGAPTTKTGVAAGVTADAPAQPVASQPTVTIAPEGTCLAAAMNRTLLDVIESNQLPIEVGCRMGLCGADPICVMEGMENLSKMSDEERTTLERLGLAPSTRMACMARVRGDVKIALAPERPEVYMSSVVAGFKYDKSVKRVVIVGNGIAGVTAADHVRRRHPTCEIHLIGRERHHLYNRMGITRLIYGRSAMQGLYLLPEKWYDDFNITSWLNTHVTTVDPATHEVRLGTGESLTYDRLILTTGSESYVPPIAGYGMAGTFVLRTAEDAMAIRAYVQAQGCRQAVIAGGGLLGLEAAYGLHKLGLEVTVLERSNALLRRQLDERAGQFLHEYLEGLGIHVMMEAETAAVQGSAAQADGKPNGHYSEPTLQQAILKDGRAVPCDIFLVAAGIRSEVALAESMGLQLNRGVVVDAHMHTSDPYIFAAGDVAEFAGKTYGLWPVAVSQAEVAAANAVAAPEAALATYTETPPVTMLKVVGIDVTSIGRIDQQAADECVIALEESEVHRYRKLIIVEGKIVGAILLGYPLEAAGVAAAVKRQIDVTPHLADLQAGRWQALAALA